MMPQDLRRQILAFDVVVVAIFIAIALFTRGEMQREMFDAAFLTLACPIVALSAWDCYKTPWRERSDRIPIYRLGLARVLVAFWGIRLFFLLGRIGNYDNPLAHAQPAANWLGQLALPFLMCFATTGGDAHVRGFHGLAWREYTALGSLGRSMCGHRDRHFAGARCLSRHDGEDAMKGLAGLVYSLLLFWTIILAILATLALTGCTTTQVEKSVDISCRAAAVASAMGWTGNVDPEKLAQAIWILCGDID